MVDPFIFVSTAAIKEGQLKAYKQRFAETAELVEANESRLLHFATYVNDEGTEETTVQVHSDAESMASHMRLVAKHIQAAREVLDFTTLHIEVYGTPTDAVLEQIRELAGSGVPVAIKTPAAGFNRLPER